MFLRLDRIWFVIKKEFQINLFDSKNRNMLLLPPLIMLFLFAYTATLEVKNATIGIFDKSNTYLTTNLIQKFENSKFIGKVNKIQNQSELNDMVDKGKILMAINIPSDFSKNIINGNGSTIQFIMDGRKSNATQVVSNYSYKIINDYLQELDEISTKKSKIDIQTRNWYNPNMDYQWSIVVSMYGVLAVILITTITSLSIAQEKELGTYDQVIVSPLKPVEIIIGKVASAIIITLFELTLMMFITLFYFKVPFAGSLITLYLVSFIFLLTLAGIGISISVLCETQQQAILGVFLFMAPAFLLSGQMTPVENMPFVTQKICLINPLTYFFNLTKGIFLKDVSAAYIINNTIPLTIIAIITISFSIWFFDKKIE